ADDRGPVELVLPLQQACDQNDQNGLKYRCRHSASKDVKEPGERRSCKPFPFLNRPPQEVRQSDAVKEEEQKANENICSPSCEFSHYAEDDDAVSSPARNLARPVKPIVFPLHCLAPATTWPSIIVHTGRRNVSSFSSGLSLVRIRSAR